MITYMNVHAALEQLRDQAAEKSIRGPRVMIAGPVDVGKSTLSRILVNYAARLERIPIFVDLDVGQGEISIPGSMGALIVQRPHDIETGYPQAIPLVYHFGHKAPGDNLSLYTKVISSLSQTINDRCSHNSNANVSGCIINTCGWIKDAGYKSLIHIASVFEVNIIIVIDQERLYTELRRDMPDFVKIIQLQKSGGVVNRTRQTRATSRDSRVRNYFYGIDKELSPHCFYVNFSEVSIYKIGAPELPASLLPLGMVMEQGETKLMPMVPSEALRYHVLSLCAGERGAEKSVYSPVSGFIVITEVDMERSRFMILSPAPAPLPGKILLDTDITFMDIK
ncbi:CLP1 [Bugula neritina]|uniref:CLP1 n=1 Tax=Bugula neritina TaxID=10212 RepID=A0A7J7IV15_BUGNE|nr:CLP1 [Bugula neritina]